MDNLEYAVLIVISINLMLILGQMSASHVNPSFGSSVIDCSGSPLGKFGNCTTNGYTFDTSNPALPTSKASIDATTGNFMTDIWNTIKGFFNDTLGLKYVTAVVSAPTSFLKGLGIDNDFANLIGALWWVFTTIILISYIKR